LTTLEAGRPALGRRPGGDLVAGLVILAGLLGLVGLVALNILQGAVDLTPADVLRAVFAPTGSNGDLFVRELRLPRAMAGIVAGAALGVAGALMQTVTRNRLASPDLMGVTAGAYLAVVVAAVVPGVPALGLPLLCFIGGIGAAALVFGLSGGVGLRPLRLILAGVAISTALG
jgi:ABC-type Fe3+-siderophore transport system permease subunit